MEKITVLMYVLININNKVFNYGKDLERAKKALSTKGNSEFALVKVWSKGTSINVDPPLNEPDFDLRCAGTIDFLINEFGPKLKKQTIQANRASEAITV